MKEFRPPSTSGIVGDGFSEASLTAGLECGAGQHVRLFDLEIPI
jgi:hypothetical protein